MILDTECNNVMNTYYRPIDYVIINSEKLHQHLLKIVPPNQFIYSTSLGIKDIDTVNKYSHNNIFVIDYMQNNNNEYLKQLININNIEVICAELCIDNCPNRKQHYIAMSKMNAGIKLDPNETTACIFKKSEENNFNSTLDKYLLSFSHAIDNKRIEELSELGVQYFKISGRERSNILFFVFITYYLILPQYRETAKKELLINAEKIKIKYNLVNHK